MNNSNDFYDSYEGKNGESISKPVDLQMQKETRSEKIRNAINIHAIFLYVMATLVFIQAFSTLSNASSSYGSSADAYAIQGFAYLVLSVGIAIFGSVSKHLGQGFADIVEYINKNHTDSSYVGIEKKTNDAE